MRVREADVRRPHDSGSAGGDLGIGVEAVGVAVAVGEAVAVGLGVVLEDIDLDHLLRVPVGIMGIHDGGGWGW